ncbi:hypothetical protein SDRG_13435 [Saprolegnia diclina VS20]|uniref:C2 domain-containing protein n=1 Tax=Saprolegnia diclina (strain VS20) TaxID=1156394 RepID=T0Q2F9_SAPDV|nr:hypothetical protein SDRG_13435 [Saprolegnia diclina VS20]EQC28751.1 hypothetical protein SDRG_13435 [Saprolegnia diclina VS20]|eukprot:XP_008617746.1 hypothetical protein SDRG_13435 [Saprolegnia diclina VS20]
MIYPAPVQRAKVPPFRTVRLEAIVGCVYVLFSLSCGLWFLVYLTPCFRNDLWWPDYNLSGHQAFLIDVLNRVLATTPEATFPITNCLSGVQKSYNGSSSVTNVYPTYPRQLALHDLSSIEYAVANLRLLSASWSMRMNTQHCYVDFNRAFTVAHTTERAARCDAKYRTNGAVFMEATLRNIDWNDFVTIWAGPNMPFTVAVQLGLEETEAGRRWLTTTASARANTSVDAEIAYWRSFNISRFVLQWQNRWQTGVTETVALENSLGMQLSTTIKSLSRVTGPWTSQNLFFIPLNDLWVMQGLNRSLVWGTSNYVGANVSASLPAIPVEVWSTNYVTGVFAAQAALFQYELGPFLSVDAFFRVPPASRIAAFDAFQAALVPRLGVDRALSAAYRTIPAGALTTPTPLAWRNYTFYGGNPMCVSSLPTSFVQQSFDFFDGCTQETPFWLSPSPAAVVFGVVATDASSAACAAAGVNCSAASRARQRLDLARSVFAAAANDVVAMGLEHMQYARSPNGTWTMLHQPLLDAGDLAWTLASWVLLREWVLGIREVVSFEGDVRSLVLMSNAYAPTEYSTSGLGQVLQSATQVGWYLVLIVSLALCGVGAWTLYLAFQRDFHIVGRNLVCFNRTVGATWVGRPLCLFRGLAAILLLSTSSVALDASFVVQLQPSPRPWYIVMLLAGEACWVTYVLNELVLVFARGLSAVHCHVSSLLVWLIVVAIEVLSPVAATATLNRQCTSQNMDYVVHCDSGIVHIGRFRRVLDLVSIQLVVVFGVTVAAMCFQKRVVYPVLPLAEPSLRLSGVAHMFLQPLPTAAAAQTFDAVGSALACVIFCSCGSMRCFFDIKLWRLLVPECSSSPTGVHLLSAQLQRVDVDVVAPTTRSRRWRRLMAVLGLLHMLISLGGSVLYLDVATTDLSNNFYWSGFNVTGGHAFVASWLTEQLVFGLSLPLSCRLDDKHINLIGAFDADVAFVASPANYGARLQHSVLTSIQVAIEALRSIDGCDAPWLFTPYCYVDWNQTWEMAATSTRQARCRAMTSNGAVYLASLVHNVDRARFTACWGKAFDVGIASELRRSIAGAHWLSTPRRSLIDEADVWRRANVTYYDTQWQNFKHIGVSSMYSIVNAYGLVYPLTLQRQNGSYRFSSQSSFKMYWGLANDLMAVVDNSSTINGCSLLRLSSVFAYGNNTIASVLAHSAVLSLPLSQGFSLLTNVLGPFGSVDMLYISVPKRVLGAVRNLVDLVRLSLTLSTPAQIAYANIIPLDSSYPVPPPWLGRGGVTFGASPLCPDVAYPSSVDIGLNNLFSFAEPCVPTTGVLARIEPSRQHYVVAAAMATPMNISASCAFDPTNYEACRAYLGQTQAFLTTYVPSAAPDVDVTHALQSLEIGFINYGYLDGAPPLQLLHAKLLDEPAFGFFAWLFLYEWVAGAREVVAFQGDAGNNLTLLTNLQDPRRESVQAHDVPVNLAQYARGCLIYVTFTMITIAAFVVFYALRSCGHVEGTNMFKFGHPHRQCMLSTASPTLHFTGVISVFYDDRPWYKLVLAANEVTWLASIISDLLLVLTREYTSYYLSVHNAVVWAIAALLTTTAPVEHRVAIDLRCSATALDFDVACDAGVIYIGQATRLLTLVGLVLVSKVLLSAAAKWRVGVSPAPVAHSLFLSAGATYLFKHDHRTHNGVYYLDRASAVMDGLLTLRGAHGVVYVLDCKSWRVHLPSKLEALPRCTSIAPPVLDLSSADTAVFRPEFCTTPQDIKATTRPFSASATTDNVFAVVHYGRGFEHLGHPTPTTFVVLRPTRRLDVATACEFWTCPAGERRVYDGLYTPFGATRVVEQSASPIYNEMIAANVPSSVRTRGVWGVVLEIIAKSLDGQDMLLAAVAMPVEYLPLDSEASMELQLPPASSAFAASASLLVTFFRTHLLRPPLHRAELTLESIGSNAMHPSLVDDKTRLRLEILDAGAAGTARTVDAPLPAPVVDSADALRSWQPISWRLTPGGRWDASAYHWQYPITFDCATLALRIQCSVYAPNLKGEMVCVGGSLPVTVSPPRATSSEAKTTVGIPLQMHSAPYSLVLRASLRIWTSDDSFRSERVMCTNRTILKTHAWMGAIARGLNRHPISSVVDTGGISGVVASLFRDGAIETRIPEPRILELAPLDHLSEKVPLSDSGPPPLVATPRDDMRDQLQTLSTELRSKQATIEKLHVEMDKRTQALRTCGTEIVDLRKTLQRKDQLLQTLQVKINNYEALEQRQQEELQLCLEGNRLTTSNMPLLAQHYRKLQTKYNDLDQSHRDLTQKLLACRNFEAELLAVQTKHREMEAAHVAQAAYVQKSQREMQKISVYKQTISTQESVIAKLEKLVDTKLAEAKANSIGPNVHAEIFRLRLENAFLKEQATYYNIVLFTSDNNSARTMATKPMVPPLRPPRQANGEASSDSIRDQPPPPKPFLPAIVARADKAVNTETPATLSSPPSTDDNNVLGVRVRVLEDQLRVIATNAAQEIAQLKAALFEHEMGAVW